MQGNGASGSHPTALVGFMLILGVAVAVFGVIYYRRGSARFAAAGSWVQTQATIIASTITTHTQMVNDMLQTSYRAKVSYRYQAAGAEREGARPFLCARTDWNSEKEANAWLAANPAGATVPVWFDPANPTDSALVLNKPSLLAAIVLTTVGVGVTILAIYLFAKM
ncbi:DUF3592 domain-containing protein [Sphingomonas sp.]|jgi:hypothetical protein|uniref:DUF3592 domain-containing protein n=1 Tax=Sphingomonas sp. TaxID=28214 RepID=UPI002E3763DD|nr:DUF3592 domain-containing protein [Sphingomonas sp.]HEX4694497.1 DUF3592 domain-containing protein [Sphingomonas sp.]